MNAPCVDCHYNYHWDHEGTILFYKVLNGIVGLGHNFLGHNWPFDDIQDFVILLWYSCKIDEDFRHLNGYKARSPNGLFLLKIKKDK